MKKTSIERYGVDHPFKSIQVQEKIMMTNQELFGVDRFMGCPEFLEKSKKTNNENLGVDWPMQSAKIQAKIDYDLASQRRHENMKTNGTYGKSRIEDEVHSKLCKIFGNDNVKRQIVMNKVWSIDFYVESIDTYFQYDSYWHGYDVNGKLRDLIEVAEFKTKQDRTIHYKMLIDIKQKIWFNERGMNLVRIIGDDYKNEKFWSLLRKGKEEENGN